MNKSRKHPAATYYCPNEAAGWGIKPTLKTQADRKVEICKPKTKSSLNKKTKLKRVEYSAEDQRFLDELPPHWYPRS